MPNSSFLGVSGGRRGNLFEFKKNFYVALQTKLIGGAVSSREEMVLANTVIAVGLFLGE